MIRKLLLSALLPVALLACATEADPSDVAHLGTTTTEEGAPGDWSPADDAGARGPNQTTTTVAPTTTTTEAPTTTTAPAPTTTTAPAPPPEAPEVTNARRSAEQYIDLMPFSRSGLIDQLEFEGYPTEAATTAVDSIAVDYHAQAVRSATSYLEMMPFSLQGLIDQLVFEGYSVEQATHGANAAMAGA